MPKQTLEFWIDRSRTGYVVYDDVADDAEPLPAVYGTLHEADDARVRVALDLGALYRIFAPLR